MPSSKACKRNTQGGEVSPSCNIVVIIVSVV